ncbi:DEAD/DEAH box helicase [Sphingobacterium suaedae]|uniref:DEAD/DEAH box helicase n=1 Tax=Sphingobacterium suaedae TaxID=1686402 RepID=A0ABW5KHN7_9SPHI
MRLSSNAYVIDDVDFARLSEVDLLAHYRQADFPDRNDIYRLRVLSLEVNHVVFSTGDSVPRLEMSITQVDAQLKLGCSCDDHAGALCTHLWTSLSALIHVPAYRVFFDLKQRQALFVDHAAPFGLEKEAKLDHFFFLHYGKDGLQVRLKDDRILPFEENKLQTLLLENPTIRRTDNNASTTRIVILTRHRFYKQLRIELADVEWSKNGKLKRIIEFIDPSTLIWKAKNADEVKFYTAMLHFQKSYDEDLMEADLLALQAIVNNPSQFRLYNHDRKLSEKITSKSIRPIKLSLFSGNLVLSVFKKMPFYEIEATVDWLGERFPLKTLRFQHRYFIDTGTACYLVNDLLLLHLLEYFKKESDRLLVHHQKYEDFKRTTLDPLAERVHIHHTYIRAARPARQSALQSQQERLLYLTQEGSYIELTPVIGYGEVEVPVYSKKEVLTKDANGNVFRIPRDLDAEDRFIALIAHQHPQFREQLQERRFFYLHHHDFLDEDWFLHAFETWRNEGITVLGFQELRITKINPHKAKVDIKILSGIDWFNAKLVVQFGDQQASVKQIHRAVRNQQKYVTLDDGSFGILPDEWLQKIARFFQLSVLEADLLKIPKVAFAQLPEVFEPSMLSEEVKGEIDHYHQRLNKQQADEASAEVPVSLLAQLRPYQQEGFQWLMRMDELGFGGCLADDMGLGKTVQIIAFLLAQREKRGRTNNLIVAPRSLIFNWQKELEKFAPTLRVMIFHGAERRLSSYEWTSYDVVLTTYGMVLSDINRLKKRTFNSIILDESQAVKNPNSERHKAVRLLQARVRFALSGTPIENNTFDLYGQLAIVCPGLLGGYQFFKDTYATPIDRFSDARRALSLQKKITPFILRRTKAQVATDLPPKNEIVIYCEMEERQRAVYTQYEQELRDFITGIDDDDLSRNRVHVLAGITKLRQICNAPALLKEGYAPSLSAKIDTLLEQLDVISSAHKIVVFSQFVGMLDLLRTRLEEFGLQYAYLTGATTRRAAAVEQFQKDQTVRIFLISLKAGGTGLNLTAADYVFLMDPWWNPAIENQAIDRIYRIGQEKQVFAIRMITPHTIEDKIRQLQDKKRQLATDIIKADEDVWSKFEKQDWLALLR